jgi:hypothetical protein
MTSNVIAKAKTASVNASSRIFGMKAAAFIGFKTNLPRVQVRYAPRACPPNFSLLGCHDAARPLTILGPNDLPGQLPDPYSSASMPWSSRKRIVPSLFFVEITKRTRPWLLVSA